MTDVSEVTGFHGTSRQAAEEIIEQGFRPSRNVYDWLGDGIYFFQDGLERARGWAKQEHGDDGAVLRAKISLDGCMDLLDRRWFSVLSEAHDTVITLHRRAGLRLPTQQGGAHGMDRLVINMAAEALSDDGQPIRSVRGIFQEGRPAFPGSALFDQAHIQIAVRDPAAITTLELLAADTHD